MREPAVSGRKREQDADVPVYYRAGRQGCGGISVNAELFEEYVTGAVLDALESPRVQEAV
jgi:hypothetical protein